MADITPPAGYALDSAPITPPPGYALDGTPKAGAAAGAAGGFLSSLKQMGDTVEGAASGAASTVFHGGELIRQGLNKLGINTEHPINKPEVQQAMTPPASPSGKAGRFAEQAAEFAGGGELADAATAGAKLLPRMLGQGAAAGGVSALQTAGDPKAMATSAVVGAAGPAVGAALKSGAKAVAESSLPSRFYQSALKPTWSMYKNDAGQMIKTGMEQGVPVSSAGLAMTEQKIKDLGQQISDGVVDRAKLGRTVDTGKVLSSLNDLEDFYMKTPAPDGPLKDIQGIRDQMASWHGKKISLDQAQELKQNTYTILRDAYGEMKSAKIEGLKSVARGLKEQIEQVFPEVAGLNEEQSKMLNLNDALYRGLWRIENHQMAGIGSPLAATAGHAIMGGPGAAVGLLGKFVLDDPMLKSKLAIALAKGGNPSPFAAATMGLKRVKAMLQESLQPSEATSAGGAQSQPSGPPATAGAQQ